MENDKSSNKSSTTQLIPCTDKNVLPDSGQMRRIYTILADCGIDLNETKIRLIKASIERNGFTIQQIEDGIQKCFDSGEYFKWGYVVKHIRQIDEPQQHRGGIV